MVILGAGFGGLELATTLSEPLGDEFAETLVDKSDAFVFGFAKLDVMFGRKKQHFGSSRKARWFGVS